MFQLKHVNNTCVFCVIFFIWAFQLYVVSEVSVLSVPGGSEIVSSLDFT